MKCVAEGSLFSSFTGEATKDAEWLSKCQFHMPSYDCDLNGRPQVQFSFYDTVPPSYIHSFNSAHALQTSIAYQALL